ncbi:UDP-N-acetylmuramate:L-alanyl-gamma-D-glutamyl-meso-diaminopimelate ligase [Sessilibacter corallicola]|uniref:UDP-N-acetylmuramate--L-alanyl-gamma-D-glutamyl-meso-2,6-diaminoheptandioate ligase n=1 Tax=Sessilibacter corallicola TaxID=2904075 RepID=A0ABQ0AAU9_9GAMM
MHIHILGICGTFMGSLAQLAKALGHRVSGCDANVYPPMSTQLESAGIEMFEGFGLEQFNPTPDLVIIGNAMSRGNPAVEYVLNRNIPYTSGPQWLCDHLLTNKWVLAVSGTHGKTTTSSMLAWILEYAGFEPGFLIGGVPGNFSQSARLGKSDFFVVEADEYDSAFFDKRSKFVHYRPKTLVINNLEFDHADIFPDIAAIQNQFHHLVRTVAGDGTIIYPANNDNIEPVIERGCWSDQQTLNDDWKALNVSASGDEFTVDFRNQPCGNVCWSLNGNHNVMNGLAAIAAARSVGVDIATACQALSEFKGVKRRMEKIAELDHVSIYDDFAHHPTAIETTLAGLRARVGSGRIIAIIELRSNTMKSGFHKHELAASSMAADTALWYQGDGDPHILEDVVHSSPIPAKRCASIDEIIEHSIRLIDGESHIVIMSNGGFGGIHQRLVDRLKNIN